MSVALAPLADFTNGEAKRLEAHGRTIVVVRINDDVYVLDDRCSHEDFPLSDGLVDAETCEIECTRHGAMFSLATGDAMTFPATTPVRRYDARVVDGMVEVVWS